MSWFKRLPIWNITPWLTFPGRYVIKSETGTGKSLVLPVHFSTLTDGRIYVVEPRRLAAKSLARTLQELGYDAGYQIRFESDPGSKILYMTDGIAIRRLMSFNPNRDVIILDEFHERRVTYDALYSLLRDYPSLIITSATIETDLDDSFEVIELPSVRMYPVETKVIELDVPSASEYHYEERIPEVIADNWDRKRILVFVPGMREIGLVMKGLMDLIEQRGFEPRPIVPIHSAIDPSVYEEFIYEPKPCVMIATNLAETSITPVDLDCVVSSGFMRQNVLVGEFEALVTVPVSMANFQQQDGRTGRTCPGLHIQFRSDNPEYPTPEILRIPLRSVYMQLAYYGINPHKLQWLDDPGVDAWEQARFELETLELVDGYRLTPLGYRVFDLGIDPMLGRLVVEWGSDGYITRGVAALVALVPQIHRVFPFFRDNNEARAKQYEWKAQYGNDWQTAMALLRGFSIRWKNGGPDEAYQWTRENYVRYSVLRDAWLEFRQIVHKLGLPDEVPVLPRNEAKVIAERGIELGIFYRAKRWGLWSWAVERRGELIAYAYIHPGSALFNTSADELAVTQVFQTTKTWLHGGFEL